MLRFQRLARKSTCRSTAVTSSQEHFPWKPKIATLLTRKPRPICGNKLLEYHLEQTSSLPTHLNSANAAAFLLFGKPEKSMSFQVDGSGEFNSRDLWGFPQSISADRDQMSETRLLLQFRILRIQNWTFYVISYLFSIIYRPENLRIH